MPAVPPRPCPPAPRSSSSRQSRNGQSLYQPAMDSSPASASASMSGFCTSRPVRAAHRAAARCPPTGASVPTAATISSRREATSSATALDQRHPFTSASGMSPAAVPASHCHPPRPTWRRTWTGPKSAGGCLRLGRAACWAATSADGPAGTAVTIPVTSPAPFIHAITREQNAHRVRHSLPSRARPAQGHAALGSQTASRRRGRTDRDGVWSADSVLAQ
jgi:hypothetical protein